MKSIFLTICILIAGASIGAAQTKRQSACVQEFGAIPCLTRMMSEVEKRREARMDALIADELDGGPGKRKQYADELNEKIMAPAGGEASVAGSRSQWLVMFYPDPKTLADLFLLREQLQDPDSGPSAVFEVKKATLAPLGFVGEIVLGASGKRLVVPFTDRTKAYVVLIPKG